MSRLIVLRASEAVQERHASDLPELPAEQLRVYLDVLRTAVDEWTRRPGAHELVVAFPEVEQLAIRRLLA